MNILITSVMGHIGFSLALNAKDKGHKVFGVVNKTLTPSKIKRLKQKRVKIIKLNLNNENIIKNFLKKNKINCCIHAAAVSHEIYAKKDPLNNLNVNSLAVLNMIKAISDLNTKIKFINISTGSVFQVIKNNNKIFEDAVPSPKSLYSGSKRMGEIVVSNANSNLKMNCCSVRISWVYGPPIVTKSLNIQRGPIPIILYKFLKNPKRMFNLKSGSSFRASFTYIDDVTLNIMKLVEQSKKLNEVYHLGTGKNNSLNEIFEILKKINKNFKYKLGKGAKPWSNDSVMRGPIASKKKYLICKYNLENGIKKYYKWLKQNA